MSGASGNPEISICIPAYNEERNLGRLLEFLHRAPELDGRSVEVLVDVSGSTDRTSEIATEFARTWGAVAVLDSHERDGLLSAIGRLLARARGRIVVRMDADVGLEPGTIGRLLRALSANGIGIVSPRIVPARSQSGWVNRYSQVEWEIHHFVSLRSPKTTVVPAFLRADFELPADCGLEDTALQQMLEKLGWKAAYVPDALVHLMPPATIRGVLTQRSRSVAHTRRHGQREYALPSTAQLRWVLPSARDAVRARAWDWWGLFVFGAVEAAARVLAVVASVGFTRRVFKWEPVDGTKEPRWPPATMPAPEPAARSVERRRPSFDSPARVAPARFGLPVVRTSESLSEEHPSPARGDVSAAD